MQLLGGKAPQRASAGALLRPDLVPFGPHLVSGRLAVSYNGGAPRRWRVQGGGAQPTCCRVAAGAYRARSGQGQARRAYAHAAVSRCLPPTWLRRSHPSVLLFSVYRHPWVLVFWGSWEIHGGLPTLMGVTIPS
jgi:hypothetical protein